jgi:hypothetical protein
MQEAMHFTYPSYNPQNTMDRLKDARERTSFNKTLEAFHIDTKKEEDLSVTKILELQYDIKPTEEDEVLNSFNANFPMGNSKTNFPHRKVPINFFYYNPLVDFSDYKSEFPTTGLVSPKKHRFEMWRRNIDEIAIDYFKREYHNPRFNANNLFIVPAIDKDNEELAEKVRVRSNRERYFKRIETSSMESKITEFLESQTDEDVAQVTDDEMDQALFEAQYTKPPKDSKPYKGIIYYNNILRYVKQKSIGNCRIIQNC